MRKETPLNEEGYPWADSFVALALIVFGVEEPPRQVAQGKPPLKFSDAKRLTGAFWSVVAVATALTLARFSEAFLVLRAQNVGLPIALVPAILVVMNVVYALAAYPAGVLSDRIGRGGVLLFGVALLIVVDLILAQGSGISLVMQGVVFWGLHMGFTQGLLATLVADTAPADLRGTAYGVFNLAKWRRDDHSQCHRRWALGSLWSLRHVPWLEQFSQPFPWPGSSSSATASKG